MMMNRLRVRGRAAGEPLVLEWLLLAGLVLVNALFSAAEVAIGAVAVHPDLRQEMEQNPGRTARTLRRLAEHGSRLLATARLGVTLAGFFAAASAAWTLVPALSGWLAGPPLGFSPAAGRAWAFVLVIFLLACVMALLGELLPKSLADRHPRPIAFAVAWPIQVMAWIFYPLVRFLAGVNDLIVRATGGKAPAGLPYVTEEEIRTLVDAGEEGGTIEQEEKEMIEGVLELGKTLVREVMVPRTDILAVEVETPLLETIDPILEAGHSRVPVYQGTIDHIVGLLYVKDLIRPLRDCPTDRSLRDLLRQAYFVPETKYVDDLLRELQQQRTHMAVVVDEYGGTAGLVTIEDLLEEIVGEIQDEYDAEEPLVQTLGPGEFLFDARVAVGDAEELAGLEIPDGDFDTLGGFVYARLGAIPSVGDQVVIGDTTITVASLHGLRLGKLRVRRGGVAPTAEAEEGKGQRGDAGETGEGSE